MFINKFPLWNNTKQLDKELEVLGFYLSDHPLNEYPQEFFDTYNIKKFDDIFNVDGNFAKVCGAILDVKERSNKEGKKYAFLTVSQFKTQFELSIFSENLYKYRNYLNEGNLLIFDIDIINNNGDYRFIVKRIQDLKEVFEKAYKRINIYCSPENLLQYKNKIIKNEDIKNQSIDIFLNINDKLVNISCKNQSIISFKNLKTFKKSKIIDYSLELSWKKKKLK